MLKFILAAILTLMPAPSPKWGESQAEFRARMALVAQAIDTAVTGNIRPVQQRQAAMAVVVKFWGESRYSPLVQNGDHRGDGGRAICMGSIHQEKMSTGDWLALAGTDLGSTTRCATETVLRLKRSWFYCNGLNPKASWPEAMVLYGTGRTCRSSESRWRSIFDDQTQKWVRLTTTRLVLPAEPEAIAEE